MLKKRELLYPSNTKQFTFALDNVEDSGFFNGYASVFNVIDQYNDVVLPGAFHNSLSVKDNVKLLWQHSSDKPIGSISLIKEDSVGLYIEANLLLDIKYGYEAYQLLKTNVINGLSIGYNIIDYDFDEEKMVRNIKEIDLWEVSLVTFPANHYATVSEVKHIEDSSVMCWEENEEIVKKIDKLIEVVHGSA